MKEEEFINPRRQPKSTSDHTELSIPYCLRGLEWQARRANTLLRNLNDKLFWIALALWAIAIAAWWRL